MDMTYFNELDQRQHRAFINEVDEILNKDLEDTPKLQELIIAREKFENEQIILRNRMLEWN